jgi:type I restriction enzyme S subunit
MALKQGYKQTEIGLIPEDWDILPIAKIGTINGRVGWKGYTVKDLRSTGAYTIGAKHIDKQNRLDLNDPTFLSQEKFLESPEIMVYKDDILIVQRGTIGKIVLIKNEIGDATINPSMLIFRVKYVEPNYAYYYLISEAGQKQILNDTSSTGVPMITQKQVLNFKIPIPQLSEQTAIANALSDMDALIVQTEKLIDKKKAIKQGAMQELLKPKEGWVTKKLGDVCEIKKGQLITDSTRINGSIPVIAGGKSPAYYHNKANRLGKTITISGSGASAGYVAFHTQPIFASDCSTISEAKNYKLEFIFYWLQLNQFRIYKMQTGGAQPHIHPSDLNPLEFNLPPIEQQNEISDALYCADLEISFLELKLNKLKQQKQGMMQALLTGKIRLI